MFVAPQRAKRLYFDVIPRATDEYLGNLAKAPSQEPAALRANPAWFIDDGAQSYAGSPVPFGMLLNLASVANAETADVLWAFLQRYQPGLSPECQPLLARLVEHAISYFRDFVRPQKRFRAPDAAERAALADLAETLKGLDPAGSDPDAIQNLVFAVGKQHGFEPLRRWFGCLYEVLLGQTEGPRFGGFVALYGVSETVALIEAALIR